MGVFGLSGGTMSVVKGETAGDKQEVADGQETTLPTLLSAVTKTRRGHCAARIWPRAAPSGKRCAHCPSKVSLKCTPDGAQPCPSSRRSERARFSAYAPCYGPASAEVSACSTSRRMASAREGRSPCFRRHASRRSIKAASIGVPRRSVVFVGIAISVPEESELAACLG